MVTSKNYQKYEIIQGLVCNCPGKQMPSTQLSLHQVSLLRAYATSSRNIPETLRMHGAMVCGDLSSDGSKMVVEGVKVNSEFFQEFAPFFV